MFSYACNHYTKPQNNTRKMDAIIHNAHAKYGRSLGTNLSSPYFFLAKEVGIPVPANRDEYQYLKTNIIRHLTMSNGRYYDYIVDKYYDTLKEWAQANNSSVQDISFGINRVIIGKKFVKKSIELTDLLKQLDDNYTEEDDYSEVSSVTVEDDEEDDSSYQPSETSKDNINEIVEEVLKRLLGKTITIKIN